MPSRSFGDEGGISVRVALGYVKTRAKGETAKVMRVGTRRGVGVGVGRLFSLVKIKGKKLWSTALEAEVGN